MTGKNDGMLAGVLALVMYVVMIATNALANILPINGITTGEVSDSFPNLFAPAGVTFSIWGVIYILLGIYTVYQLIYTRKDRRENSDIRKINFLYIVTSIANSLWIYYWHNLKIGITLVLMLVILFALIAIAITVKSMVTPGNRMGWIRIPFSIYFGWITIATIANVTAYLVDSGFGGFGISESIWTVIILLVGLAIGGTTIWRLEDKWYGLVMIWAYSGILLKHVSPDGFAGEYPIVIATAGISVGIFISIIFLTGRKKRGMFI